MHLARVIGTVVASRIYEGLDGIKLLIIQPLNHDLKPKGGFVVAVDTVQAGPDDLVYMVTSREASMALEEAVVPVDHAIVGIVDALYPDEIKTSMRV